MIKVGDYIKFNNKIDRVEEIIPTPNNKYMIYLENVEHGILFDGLYESRIVDYKQLYLEEKLRADELEDEVKAGQSIISNLLEQFTIYAEHIERADRTEKRWSELREQMEHDEKEAFGEGDVIAYTVHNYVLELMHDLEEDGE